jgi:DNA-binding MarR family transcriptional regulator
VDGSRPPQLHNTADRDAYLALEGLFELAVRLPDVMDSGLGQLGLSGARAEVIWPLARQGSATQRELSEALRCTPRNVTGLVDALEASGLVARRPHPTDRRATLVGLTKKGSEVAEGWRAGYRKMATGLFEDLPLAQLTTFVDTVGHVVRRLGGDGGSSVLGESG